MPKIFTNEECLLTANKKTLLQVIPEITTDQKKKSLIIIHGIIIPGDKTIDIKKEGLICNLKIYKNRDYITLFLDNPSIEDTNEIYGIFIDISISREIKLIKGKQVFSYETNYASIETPTEIKTSKFQLKIITENSIIIRKTIKSEKESYIINSTTGIPIQTGTPIISYHQLTKNGWIEMDPSEYFLKHVKDKDIRKNIKEQLDNIKQQTNVIIKKVKAKGKEKIDLIIDQTKQLKKKLKI
nr:MAG: hypothetical protein [Lokiarchaeota virus Skoll Meg22_1214]